MQQPVEYRERLSDLLRSLCKERSQYALAVELGVSHASVSDWINEKKYPGESSLKRIARVSGYSIGELHAYLEGGDPCNGLTLERIIRELDRLPAGEVAALINAAANRLAERTAPYKVS